MPMLALALLLGRDCGCDHMGVGGTLLERWWACEMVLSGVVGCTKVGAVCCVRFMGGCSPVERPLSGRATGWVDIMIDRTKGDKGDPGDWCVARSIVLSLEKWSARCRRLGGWCRVTPYKVGMGRSR